MEAIIIALGIMLTLVVCMYEIRLRHESQSHEKKRRGLIASLNNAEMDAYTYLSAYRKYFEKHKRATIRIREMERNNER